MPSGQGRTATAGCAAGAVRIILRQRRRRRCKRFLLGVYSSLERKEGGNRLNDIFETPTERVEECEETTQYPCLHYAPPPTAPLPALPLVGIPQQPQHHQHRRQP